MQNNWFSNKAEEIERYAASNNSKEFYMSLNAIYGRQSSAGSAPLLDAKGEHLIVDKGKILERRGDTLKRTGSSVDHHQLRRGRESWELFLPLSLAPPISNFI